MSTNPFDLDRLKAENVSKLNEREQEQLLEDVKAEVARVEALARGAQREAIRKTRQQIARHEAQSAWFSGELKKIEDLLGSRSSDADTAEQRRARALLEHTRTFYRSGRKLLTIQLQDLRENFSKVSAELTGGFEVGDPFNTYEWRKASAECDLAALQVMMGQYELGHLVLCSTLGLERFPAADLVSAGASGPLGAGPLSVSGPLRGSRELTSAPAKSGKLAASSLGLEEALPEPGDLTGDGEAPIAAESVVPRSSAASPQDDPKDLLSTDDLAIVDRIGQHLRSNPQIEERCRTLASQLTEINGLIRHARNLASQINALPPKEGVPLLQQPIWNKINGKVYALQRLGEQCADDKVLAMLFPKNEPPVLPFLTQGDSETRSLAESRTDKLGLPD